MSPGEDLCQNLSAKGKNPLDVSPDKQPRCASAEGTGSGFRIPGAVPDHRGKDEAVDRIEHVPVQGAAETLRRKERGLNQLGFFRAGRVDLPLQPGLARDLHLGSEAEEARGFDRLHAPEVDRIADQQFGWMAPAAPQARPADQAVEQSAHPPCPIPCGPAAFTAEAGNLGEDIFGAGFGAAGAGAAGAKAAGAAPGMGGT